MLIVVTVNISIQSCKATRQKPFAHDLSCEINGEDASRGISAPSFGQAV
jgi:hypothetical protein